VEITRKRGAGLQHDNNLTGKIQREWTLEELKNDDNYDIFILQINLMDDARINSRFDSDYHSKKLFMKSPVGWGQFSVSRLRYRKLASTETQKTGLLLDLLVYGSTTNENGEQICRCWNHRFFPLTHG
jgi:hypothetical protein